MSKKKKELEETRDMSMTFISDINQKSAVAEDTLSDISGLPDIKKIDAKKKDTEEDYFADYHKNRNKNRNKNQKKKWCLLIILFMILSLGVGFFGASFLFEKEKAKEKKIDKIEKKEEQKEEEELSIDSLFLKELVARYDYPLQPKVMYHTLYQKEKIEVEDMDEDYLRAVIAIHAVKNFEDFTISNSDFQDSSVILFGTQRVLDDKSATLGEESLKINYNEESLEYSLKWDFTKKSKIKIEKKITKAVEKENTLEVEVAIAFLDEEKDKVYKEYDKEDLSEEVEAVSAKEFVIEKDYDKLKKYRYLFEYDSMNHNYYLKGIELIK